MIKSSDRCWIFINKNEKSNCYRSFVSTDKLHVTKKVIFIPEVHFQKDYPWEILNLITHLLPEIKKLPLTRIWRNSELSKELKISAFRVAKNLHFIKKHLINLGFIHNFDKLYVQKLHN